MSAIAPTEESKGHVAHKEHLIYLNQLPQDLQEALSAFDLDGSGTITTGELAAAGKSHAEAKKAHKRTKIVVSVVGVIFCVILALQFGVMYAAIQLAKDSVVGTNAVMTTKAGSTVQLASSEFTLLPDGTMTMRLRPPTMPNASAPTKRRMLAVSDVPAGAGSPLKTSEALVQSGLSSQYPQEAFEGLKWVSLTSATGVSLNLAVSGTVIQPPVNGRGGPVTLITQFGHITLVGEDLYYTDDSQEHLFASAGFVVAPEGKYDLVGRLPDGTLALAPQPPAPSGVLGGAPPRAAQAVPGGGSGQAEGAAPLPAGPQASATTTPTASSTFFKVKRVLSKAAVRLLPPAEPTAAAGRALPPPHRRLGLRALTAAFSASVAGSIKDAKNVLEDTASSATPTPSAYPSASSIPIPPYLADKSATASFTLNGPFAGQASHDIIADAFAALCPTYFSPNPAAQLMQLWWNAPSLKVNVSLGRMSVSMSCRDSTLTIARATVVPSGGALALAGVNFTSFNVTAKATRFRSRDFATEKSQRVAAKGKMAATGSSAANYADIVGPFSWLWEGAFSASFGMATLGGMLGQGSVAFSDLPNATDRLNISFVVDEKNSETNAIGVAGSITMNTDDTSEGCVEGSGSATFVRGAAISPSPAPAFH